MLDAGVIRQKRIAEQTYRGWISPVLIARMTHRPTGPRSSKLSDKPKIDLLQRGRAVPHCRVPTDLAGPKVRTGALEVENRPLKLSVPKDSEGCPSRLLEGYLDGRRRANANGSANLLPHFVLAFPFKRIQRTCGSARRCALKTPGSARVRDVSDAQPLTSPCGTGWDCVSARRGYHPWVWRRTVGRLSSHSRSICVSGLEIPFDCTATGDRPGHLQRQGDPTRISCTLPEALRQVGSRSSNLYR